MDCCVGQAPIVPTNYNLIPLLFSACEIDICQTLARIEGLFTNGGHATTYYHTCQTGTTREGISTYGGHTVGDDDTCQVGATIERRTVNGSNFVRDNHVC